MRPVIFDEHNRVFAKDQPEYLPLPAHISTDEQRTVTTCWELTEEEIKEVSRTGKIYFQQLTFGHPLQPQRPSVEKPELI